MNDLRFGLRALRRSPAFTVAAVLTLGLAIGANAAIFSVVEAVALRPLPFPRPDQLVQLGTGSVGEYEALRERLRTVEGLAMFVSETHPVQIADEVERVTGAAVSGNLLSTLGVTPLRGRDFTPDEDAFGGPGAIIISDSYWRNRFGGAPEVIGSQLLLEGAPFTVIGVMAPGFAFPDRHTQYWITPRTNTANLGMTWAIGGKRFIARLTTGNTLAAAQREAAEVWPTLRRLNPLWDPGDEYRRNVTVVPLHEAVVGSAGSIVWLLFGCVTVVLLVGCVNVANLLLARATSRERELSVRAALGGGRARLVRQLLTESVLLSIIGGILGVGIAWGLVQWLVAILPAGVPRAETIGLNFLTVGFTAAIALVTGLIFGVVPAFRATGAGIGAGKLAATTRTTAGARHQRVASALVASEVALAVMLAIGATLLARSLRELRDVDTGFRPQRVIAARMTPPAVGFDVDRLQSFYSGVLERVQGVPGVESASLVDKLPFGGEPVWGFAARIAGQYEDASRVLPDVAHLQAVSSDFFATLGVQLKSGRVFSDGDAADGGQVAVISESVAKRFWPQSEALGQRIGYPYNNEWMTVVGVVADIKQDSLRDTSYASVFVPWRQRSRMSMNEMWVVARSAGDPSLLISSIRAVVRELEPGIAVSSVRTMEEAVVMSAGNASFVTMLFGAFAAAALLLGIVGIYGVMSYVVGQRTREMGIRIALGARPTSVVSLVVGRGAAIAVIGAAAGVILALASSGALRSWLYGVSATDPLTILVVPTTLVVVAALASWLPARRATRVDPALALRSD